MTPRLLWRGMLVGVLAAVLAFLFARAFAEPQVDLAIAYEAAREHAELAAMPGMNHAPELVSRATQKGIGLLTAVGLYGAAVGGIFALVFAYAYGRLARLSPRGLALVMAGTAFLVVGLVPALKYPPTPPAVGQHETVALRTAAFFLMIAFSVIAAVLAMKLGRRLVARLGALNAGLVAAGSYGVLIAVAQMLLPRINEVPTDFPATVLWNFRIASVGMQALLWTTIGIGFGAMAKRVIQRG